jgi:hypothetical protein
VREHISEPVRDQAKLRKLLPIANQIYRLREAGIPYDAQLKRASKLVGRIIDETTVAYVFGTGGPEYFARRLLTDWDNLPLDLSVQEMLELLQAVLQGRGSADRAEYWIKCLEVNTGEPALSDLIYWPDKYKEGKYADRELSPAEILEIASVEGRQARD